VIQKTNISCLVFILLVSFLSSCINSNTAHSELIAREGVFNLSSVDFSKNIYSIEGEWRFIWNQFLEPEDPQWNNPNIIKTYIPGLWKDIIIEDNSLTNTGYCSMQVEVQTPPGYSKFGLKINQVGTAYTLFIDSTELIKNGKPGIDRSTSQGNYQPRIVYFETLKARFTITMHIANFHDPLGGGWTRIYIGSDERISIREYFLLLGFTIF